jgi:hypothetical protein
MLVWEAKSFDRVAPGQNWPLRSVEELYVPVETSPARHVLTTNLTIDSIKFDQIYASTLFWPTEEPGATVWNQVENSHWIVPGKDPGAKEKKTTAAQVQPIDMDPPRDATSSIAFGAILMGVTCLLVGALIWWRRRVA